MYSSVYSFEDTWHKYKSLQCLNVLDWHLDDCLSHPYAIFAPLSDDQLEVLANRAAQLTRQRFGHVLRFFIPLYLSNECYNACSYCGFSYEHDIDRYTLNESEIVSNIDELTRRGFQHVLLLTGESKIRVEMDYFKQVLPLIRPKVSQLGMEVQPLSISDYQTLIRLGLDQLTIYQETYHKDHYAMHHLSGKKRRFDYRLDTPDRVCQAGIFKLNIGALLGLSYWQFDAIALVDHLTYLSKQYWQTHLSVSFPRITSIFSTTNALQSVSDRELVQLICAFRCLFPDLGITLSTRETERCRNGLLSLGITDMSAESITSPGGYTGICANQQFSTSDHRSLLNMKQVVSEHGLDAVTKDWQSMI